MLSALFKAFTGRGGALGSLLALLIVALIAFTVVDRLPKIEQKVLLLSQDYLNHNMASGDTLMSLQVLGREVHLGGDFQDAAALKSGLESIQGVAGVFLIGSSVATSNLPAPVGSLKVDADDVDIDKAAISKVTEVVTELQVEEQPAAQPDMIQADAQQKSVDDADEPVAAVLAGPAEITDDTVTVNATADVDPELDKTVASDEVVFEESSLTLRYDGRQLKLSGHVADAQMAALLVDAVAKAVPPYSVLTSDVDGNGKASPLNWMRRFLRMASGLPEDAQGSISGSDSKGVQLMPDEQQTLNAAGEDEGEQDRAINQQRETNAARVEIEPDSTAQSAAPEVVGDVSSEESAKQFVSAEQTATVPPSGEAVEGMPGAEEMAPPDFIVLLNKRLSDAAFFQDARVEISETLAHELDELVLMMQRHPSLYLRIIGNIDPSAGPEFEEFIGMDRARNVQEYLRRQQLDGSRVFTASLPRGYAFDKRVQLVFYISE